MTLAGAAVVPTGTQAPPTTPSTATAGSACATPTADMLALFKAQAVTAEDSGKTLVVHQTDRFSVFLDDQSHPLSDLRAEPKGILGTVSNGSIRGPNCYPIMFEAVAEGSAELLDRDFHLRVVINNAAQVSTLPLH